MLTNEIIEEFFEAIDNAENNTVLSLLTTYPNIVTTNFLDEKPYQTAQSSLDIVKQMYENDPSCPEFLENATNVFKTIIDATVTFAIDNQDIALLQHMKDNHNTPYKTLSNGIDPMQYAIDNKKTNVVNWIQAILDNSKRALGITAQNPYSMFSAKKQDIAEKTAALSLLKNNAIIDAGAAAFNNLSIRK